MICQNTDIYSQTSIFIIIDGVSMFTDATDAVDIFGDFQPVRESCLMFRYG